MNQRPDWSLTVSNDPRLSCPFCAQLGHDVQSVALAPQHTGGDVDRAAAWVPVCQDHLDGWFDDVTDDERLPIVPRSRLDTPQMVWVALWDDESGEREAQVYTSEEAARRDFPGAGSAPSIVNVIRSTVQD